MNSMKPLVSVIIPLYNHARFIQSCLQSVYDQSYNNLEIVLVNDGSQDQSPQVARRYLKQSPYPYTFIDQENQGAHAAINRGIAQSKGSYISILNSDDLYHPDRIASLEKTAAEKDVQFLYTEISHIDDGGRLLEKTSPRRFYYQRSLAISKFFPTPSFELIRQNMVSTTSNFFFKHRLFQEVGQFRSFVTCHDWDFLLRTILITEPYFLKEELLNYRVHQQSTLNRMDHVRDQEVDRVVSGYLMNMDKAENPLAPAPQNWDVYWDHFAEIYLKHIYKYPRSWKLLQEIRSDEKVKLTRPGKLILQTLSAQAKDNFQITEQYWDCLQNNKQGFSRLKELLKRIFIRNT